MSKVVKLTQYDIEKIVTNIVSEQETGGYQLPDGEITYDTSDEKDYSAELEEVDFGNSDELEEDFEGDDMSADDQSNEPPAGVSLGIGQDGYLYAIDPKTMSVVSKIKM